MLTLAPMTRVLRIFQPEIAAAIKLTVVIALASAYIITFAWGYESRQEARRWREAACTYRVSELERATPGVGGTGDACDVLERVGVSVLAGVR